MIENVCANEIDVLIFTHKTLNLGLMLGATRQSTINGYHN